MSGPDQPTGASADSGREQVGTTRAGQPIESEHRSIEEIEQAEHASEAAIEQGRKRIGTTRGGQPIETVTHDASADPAAADDVDH